MSRLQFRAGRAALVLTLLLGGLTLAFPQNTTVAADPPAQFISISVPQHFVDGFGWFGDSSVSITVGVGPPTTVGVDGNGTLQRLVLADNVLTPGTTVTVTGSTVTRTAVIPTLTVDVYDVPADVVTGSVLLGSSLELWMGDGTNNGRAASTVDGSGRFTVDFRTGTQVLDLKEGMGGTAHVTDADGDTVELAMPQVPNPMIEAWWPGGVAVSGWPAAVQVHLTLRDNDGNVGEWTVTTDENGFYWGIGLPQGWSSLEPGYVATATGPVLHREVSTITKTTTVYAPFPNITETTVSGTVSGMLTPSTLGPGSRVDVIAFCATERLVNRSTTADATGGYVVDFTQPPGSAGGWGTCTPPIDTVLIRFYDADGDMNQAWWVRVPHPQVIADPSTGLSEGNQVTLTMQGWDMTQLAIAQCELVGGQPGECDPTTAQKVTASPLGDEAWPSPLYAGGEYYGVTVHRYLALNGGRPVDCQSAPNACALVVTEQYRPGPVRAWAPLSFQSASIQVGPSGGLSSGQNVSVTGTGFPNGVNLIMCAANGGANGCDQSTMQGGIQVDQFGNFSTGYTVSRYLNTGIGGVDCGTAPGACALVAFDPGNPFGLNARSSLSFLPPLGPLVVTITATGSVSSVSGWATVSGTVTCSATGMVDITGSVWQRIDKRTVAQGGFTISLFCVAGQRVNWTATVVPGGPPIVPFAGNTAQVNVHAQMQRFDDVTTADKMTNVKLTKTKK